MKVKETNIPNNKDCTYTLKYHVDPNKYKTILDPLDPIQRGIVDAVLETSVHSELSIKDFISDDSAERLKEGMKKLYGSEGN